MVIRHYDQDSSKQQARELLLSRYMEQLIEPGFITPKESQMLFLPGIDCCELDLFRDRTGMPISGFVGVERDLDIYQQIRKREPNLFLHNESMENYLLRQDQINFDVISLDYMGVLKQPELCTLELILQKQQKNRFILHNAFLGSRERDQTYEILETVLRTNTLLDHLSKGYQLQQLLQQCSENTKEELCDKKEEIYCKLLPVLTQSRGINLQNMIRFMDRVENMTTENIEQYPRFVYELFISKDSILRERLNQKITRFHRIMQQITKYHNLTGDEAKTMIKGVMRGVSSKYFDIESHDSYQYISVSRHPMHGQIVSLVYPYKIHQFEEELVDRIKTTLLDVQLPKHIRRLDQMYGDQPLNFMGHDFGSSSKPRIKPELEVIISINTPTKLKKITHEQQQMIPEVMELLQEDKLEKLKMKNEAREYLEAGFEVQEVRQSFPQLSNNEIGALKAWITMRKKGTVPVHKK